MDSCRRKSVLILGVLCPLGCWWGGALPTDGSALLFHSPDRLPKLADIAGTPVFTRESVFDLVPGKAGSHAATLTAFSDGELLAAWYSYEGPHELVGSAIYMSRRPQGGDSWAEPWVHVDRPEGDGNPVLYSEGDQVWLFQAVVPGLWSTAHIEMQISNDRGRTWSEPISLPGPPGANTRFPPVRTAAGLLLLPAYDDLFQASLFYTSEDGRQWWLMGRVSTSPANIQPSVAALPDGRLIAVMRNTASGWLWVMASEDGGESWTAPVDSGFPNPGSPASLLQLSGGGLLLVFNDSPVDRAPLSAALSYDGGVTWPYRRILLDGDSSYSYPAVVQGPGGAIHILCSLGRERIEHITCNEAWLAIAEPLALDVAGTPPDSYTAVRQSDDRPSQ